MALAWLLTEEQIYLDGVHKLMRALASYENWASNKDFMFNLFTKSLRKNGRPYKPYVVYFLSSNIYQIFPLMYMTLKVAPYEMFIYRFHLAISPEGC